MDFILHCFSLVWIYNLALVSAWGDTDKAFYLQKDMQGVDFATTVQTVTTGDTAVLSCSFDALPRQYMLMYGYDSVWLEWVKVLDDGRGKLLAVGNKLKTDDKRYQVIRVPHHRALSILVIRHARPRDSGRYRCHLSLATIRHKYFDLKVSSPSLSIIHNKTRIVLKEKDNLNIYCNATGLPKPIVHWTRKLPRGQSYFPNGQYIIWGDRIYLEGLRQEDSGKYTCHVDNFVSKRRQIEFHVVISDSPKYLEVFQNGINVGYLKTGPWWPTPDYDLPFTLMCLTKSKSPARIIWFKNGHAIDPKKHGGMEIKTKKGRYNQFQSELYIRRFKNFDLGKYTCRASTMAGSLKYTFKLDKLKGWPPAGLIKDTPTFPTDDEDSAASGSGDDEPAGSGSGSGPDSDEDNGKTKFDSKGRIKIIKATDAAKSSSTADESNETEKDSKKKGPAKGPKKSINDVEAPSKTSVKHKNRHHHDSNNKFKHKSRKKNKETFRENAGSTPPPQVTTIREWGRVDQRHSNAIPEDRSEKYLLNITETNETELMLQDGQAASSGDGSGHRSDTDDSEKEDGEDDDANSEQSGYGPAAGKKKDKTVTKKASKVNKNKKRRDDIYFKRTI
ncbi:uncharacterized protein LOC141899830 [Tubulanus polymorphus]|uniref:uncharacterized protein LOC141899830 n=1 Tax=Tubulanus polymorphus TaxID=672921 RepID=UPI003DA5D824